MYDSENDLGEIYTGMGGMDAQQQSTQYTDFSRLESAISNPTGAVQMADEARVTDAAQMTGLTQTADAAQTTDVARAAEAAQTTNVAQAWRLPQMQGTVHAQTQNIAQDMAPNTSQAQNNTQNTASNASLVQNTAQAQNNTQNIASNTSQAQNTTQAQTWNMAQRQGAAQGQTSSRTDQRNVYAPQPERYTRQERREPQKKKGHGFQKVMVSLSLGLLFGIFAGVGFVGVTQAYNAIQKNTPAAAVETNATSGVVESEKETVYVPASGQEAKVIYTSAQTDVTSIVKEVMPAMVSITNNYTEVTTFWGQTYREDLSSSGSGIIVSQTDDELLIVTNQHVVADADELLVTLDDGTEVAAKIKGTDKSMDLAVIAISTADLSTDTLNAISVASLGDSDELELGEQVIAIGNALGYGQSVTVGYISALDREIELDDGSLRSFIQTDAAINPGNSGGALLNAAGEVIGINSNKIGGSSIEGMGYAIPITAASPIIGDLMERQTRNKVKDSDMGYMGISYQEVTDEISRMYGMPKGVYVVNVQEGSSAEAAGIMKGDVITKFDGEGISSFEDLQDVLQYFAAGDTATVTIMRPANGEYVEHQLEITLGARPNRNR